MLKFIGTVLCAKISNLLNNMLSNNLFQVFLRNQSRRWRRLNNGIPQGSVLDIIQTILPSSSLKPFQYADDIALTHHQARKFEDTPKSIKNWSMCVCHLGTHDANRKLTVQFDNTLISNHSRWTPEISWEDSGPNAFLETTSVKNWNEGEVSCQLSSKIVRHLMRLRNVYVTNSLYSACLLCDRKLLTCLAK
jgi:hypothetical protein